MLGGRTLASGERALFFVIPEGNPRLPLLFTSSRQSRATSANGARYFSLWRSPRVPSHHWAAGCRPALLNRILPQGSFGSRTRFAKGILNDAVCSCVPFAEGRMNLHLHLQIVGLLLTLLGVSHIFFNRYFGWSKELQAVSLLTRRVFFVHSFFVAMGVALSGLLTLFYANGDFRLALVLRHGNVCGRRAGVVEASISDLTCRFLGSTVRDARNAMPGIPSIFGCQAPKRLISLNPFGIELAV
jgi:hypothetical protein